MAPLNLPLLFGSVVAGAVVIDYGLKSTKKAFAGAGSSTSSGTVTTAPGAATPTPNAAGYVNPIPGYTGKWGRSDQGVDVAPPPGTPIYSIGRADVIGILQNWYSGQPYVWTQLLDGPNAGEYVYYAEQITPTVKAGDRVAAGAQLGTVASSGTGLELGFATKSGETLARSTTGYTEGQATPAGQRFRQLLAALGASV